MPHLGEKLKSYREAKEWKQPEMADFLDIGYRTYQTIEKTGDVKLVSDLKKILSIIDWDPQVFAYLGGEETMRKPEDPQSFADLLAEIRTSSDETNVFVKAILTSQIGYFEAVSGTLDRVAKLPEGTTAEAAGTIEQRIWKMLQQKGIEALTHR